MSTACRLRFLGVFLVSLTSRTLYADLSTGGTLSLEWLVDSSDAIYVVRLKDPETPDEEYFVRPVRLLKIPANAGVAEQCHQLIDQIEFSRNTRYGNARDGDHWLVFIRTWDTKPPTVVRRINLTRPLERSATAAINSEGVPLPEEERIIQAVDDRVHLDRQLSERARQVRENVDAGGGWYDSPFGDPAPLESCLGGFPVAIDCDLWDSPPTGERGYRIHDEDLLLIHAIVPADPKYQKELIEAAEDAKDWFARVRAICALVNYPGEDTERVLERIDSRFIGWSAATKVLWYLQFRQDLSDPLNSELVGQWRLAGQRELIDVTLDKSNTFTATGFSRPPQEGEESRRLWEGRGYWVVRGGELTLWRREFLHPKLGWMAAHHRTIFEDKPVMEVLPDEVVLKDGPPMLKRSTTDPN